DPRYAYAEPAAGALLVLSLAGLVRSLARREPHSVPNVPQLTLATVALVAMNVTAWWLPDRFGQCGLLATILACGCFFVVYLRLRHSSPLAGLLSATAFAALFNLLQRLDASVLAGVGAGQGWTFGDTLAARLLSAVVNLTLLTLWFRRIRQDAGERPAPVPAPVPPPAPDESRNRQKIETLSYVGHDLRAPLATIQGYVRLLRASPQAPKPEHLDAIERSVAFQLALVEEVLDYAKAELQPLHVAPGPTSLRELLEELMPYASVLASTTGNRFSYLPPAALPASVRLDGHRLQQVLLNLLSNAAKFTSQGTIVLRVSARRDAQHALWHLGFSVEDSGMGMTLTQQECIFDAFVQLERSGCGVGLGLFIAQRIVEQMGGGLRVRSAPDAGSTFSFEIEAAELDGARLTMPTLAPRETAVSALFPTGQWLDVPPAPARLELAMLARDGLFSEIEDWLPRTVALHPGFDDFYAEVRKAVFSLDLHRLETLALHGLQPA
ncbi:MAG: HAMP domain-containing sensor histidine kinase, partial [Bordetella sp.]|nr:HAMP domain-containing sensor histidine kinase [Bordetella sp.]